MVTLQLKRVDLLLSHMDRVLSNVLFEQSGVPASLEEGDMKKYLKQVLIETQKDKNVTGG
jgi:hypothetical protein